MKLVFLLAICAGLDGMAQSRPPGAAALGYTLCLINERPTASDIAPGNNGDYKWFSGQWWQSPEPSLTNYSTVSNILELSLGGDLVSTPLDFSTGVLPLLAGSSGFYAEFDVQLSDNDPDHWPAVWLMPAEHNAQQQDHYPGDPAGYERWMELDVDEGGWGPGLLGTVHSWTGIWPDYSSIWNPNNESTNALDRTQKHTFGGSYDPVHQTTAWWLDGVYQMSAGAPDVPAVAVQQHFYLILTADTHGENKPYTMAVSGVRAYVPLDALSLQLITPVLRNTAVTAQSFTLTWNALSGQKYQVQCSTNLWATNWNNLGNPITATNWSVSVSEAVTNTQRFFRVSLQL
ncbi:MAG: hypothetical protein ACLQU4_12595 [Limisphaerales bacterium]